jgi:hypothetical protein
MNDGFVVNRTDVAAALIYVHGSESLTRIVLDPEKREQMFHIDAPSLDCEAYLADFDNGCFSISDLKDYLRMYSWLVNKLKAMQKFGHTEWCSESWVAGRG